MTDAELAAIMARAVPATPGPWEARGHDVLFGTPQVALARLWYGEGSTADAAFIAHAREDIPALLAEVGAWRAFARLMVQVPPRADSDNLNCFFHGACDPCWVGPIDENGHWRHHPDCPVTKARALLGQDDHDATSTD